MKLLNNIVKKFTKVESSISSSETNKVIRRIISPALRDVGFTKVRTRHNWNYLDNRIWYVMIKSVGSYFSDVTGYPSQSLVAEYGVYFTDFPLHPSPALRSEPKIDKDGLLLPKEYQCHFRRSLTIINKQDKYRKTITSEVEKNRDDIWWISKDGSNIVESVEDIRASLVQLAIPTLKSIDKNKMFELWCGKR